MLNPQADSATRMGEGHLTQPGPAVTARVCRWDLSGQACARILAAVVRARRLS